MHRHETSSVGDQWTHIRQPANGADRGVDSSLLPAGEGRRTAVPCLRARRVLEGEAGEVPRQPCAWEGVIQGAYLYRSCTYASGVLKVSTMRKCSLRFPTL